MKEKIINNNVRAHTREEMFKKNNCVDDVRVAYPLFQTESSGSIPTSTLQLNIQMITVKRAVILNELWHSRLPFIGNAFCCFAYGAEYENVYYAIALWSHPIASNRLIDGDKMLELRRMAIASDAPKNTASRMLRIMKNDIKKVKPHIIKLISYQDTEVHNGTIYKAAGWKVAAKVHGISWTTKLRNRNKEQTMADKIRWEYNLRPNYINKVDKYIDNEQLELDF